MSGQKAGTRRPQRALLLDGPSERTLVAVGLIFGVEAHFLPEARKKISFTGSWLHFLEASHSSGRGFPAGFRRGAHCSPANSSSSSAVRISGYGRGGGGGGDDPHACGDPIRIACEQVPHGL
jgi:hypothetical protein